MCANDDNVSPYLRRPLRSYEEVTRERAERARRASQADIPSRAAAGGPAGKGDGDVELCS